MDGKNILEIYDASGKMQKAMYKNKVIWKPDRRIPATVFFQEIEYGGMPPITEEAVRKCLDYSNFKAVHISGFKKSEEFYKFLSKSKEYFGEPPHGKIFICAMTEMRFYMISLNSATQLGLIPYHIFESEIEREINPILYERYIQPVKEMMDQKIVDGIINYYQSARKRMEES